MTEQPDNLVLRLLQELRADVQAIGDKVDGLDERFAGAEAKCRREYVDL